jgi:hypothetical protein
VIRRRSLLSGVVTGDGWIGMKPARLEKIARHVQDADWAKGREDRDEVFKRISKHLSKVDEKEYDMTQLEDGIHEFRRDLRWFVFDAVAVNGLLNDQRKSCPVAEYKGLLQDPLAKSPHAQLPANPAQKGACAISKCLYLAVCSAVVRLGEIKDEGEREEATGCAAPSAQASKDRTRRALAIHEEIQRTRLLERLIDQVDTCREENGGE